MRLPVTVILSAAPGGRIEAGAIEAAQQQLEASGAPEAAWLTPGEAWRARLWCEEGGLAALRARVREALAGSPLDVNVLHDDPAYTTKRLLVSDLESTLIEQEMLDEMARDVGCHDEIARITAATMRGEIPFDASVRQRVQQFAGLTIERVLGLASRMTLMPGAERLVSGMKRAGARVAIVTGGFSIFADLIGERLGADHVIANRFEVADGRLTGRLTGPVVGPAGKEEALRQLAASYQLDLAQTMTAGDGANDLAMLAAAGLGVAFRAKPRVREAQLALATGAVIDHGDFSALLDLQGLEREASASSR